MKLKNFLLIFKTFLIFTINNIQAQLSNEECIQNLSIFAESAKVKNYEAEYAFSLATLEFSSSNSSLL